MPNRFADIPHSLPDELIETILSRPSFHIERIVSHGHASPDGFWYDQPQHEFVVLLKESGPAALDDELIEMKLGSFIEIPAHRKHRVEWMTPDEPTVWLVVHYGD